MDEWIEALLNFLFPPRCPLCHKYVEERGDWCSPCLRLACQPHRLPVTAPMQSVIDSAWALSVYRGGTSELIRGLKYHGRKGSLPYIWNLLKNAGVKQEIRELLQASDVAVVVPLHEKKQRKRGFNQAELIFKEWLENYGLLLTGSLCRIRQTKPMYELSPRERRKNLKGAFKLTDSLTVRGKDILLVDDILTTGATACACAEVLKAAGARRVRVLVLASDHR